MDAHGRHHLFHPLLENGEVVQQDLVDRMFVVDKGTGNLPEHIGDEGIGPEAEQEHGVVQIADRGGTHDDRGFTAQAGSYQAVVEAGHGEGGIEIDPVAPERPTVVEHQGGRRRL